MPGYQETTFSCRHGHYRIALVPGACEHTPQWLAQIGESLDRCLGQIRNEESEAAKYKRLWEESERKRATMGTALRMVGDLLHAQDGCPGYCQYCDQEDE